MSARSVALKLAGFSLFAALFVTSPAFAWGCKGHQTVALIAEKHLTPEARQILETLLKENPIDPQLKRYCGPFPGSLLENGEDNGIGSARNHGALDDHDVIRRFGA